MKHILRVTGVMTGFLVGFLFLVSGTKAELPQDFQSNLVVGSGLNGPSGFGIAPDGRIFILERQGAVKIYKNGALLPNEFTNLPSAATGDRGLIGVAFDPDFSQNHFVYFYYTGTDLLNRLVRLDASGDVATAAPVTIYRTHFLSQELHVGGTVAFGSDGKIYLAVGDNGYPPNGQDLSNPHGKILRLNKDGSVPSDNPFYGQSGKLGEIWAYGFRNPWRFSFDQQTNKLYAGDVGEGSFEELNEVVKGQNYGWPICEGYCSQFTQPLYAYGHSGPSSAITEGPVYRANMFPSQYQGNLFFGDYGQGFIRRAIFNGSGAISSVENFNDTAGSVVDLHVAPDGSLYYLTYYPGQLYRISYSTGNHNPVANSTSNATKGLAPLTVQFSSSGSFDPDGTALSYMWNFGDGSESFEVNPTKTYVSNGTYTVQLTVSDGVNSALAVPIVIQVGQVPKVTLASPLNNSNYRAGDTIFYSAHAVDGAGFDLPDANYKTEVTFHHHDHIHPFLGPITSKNGTFTIPTTGEPDPDTWYEIKVTGTDSTGLSDSATANIYPLKSTITFQTEPSGLDIVLDGTPHHTPISVQGVVGFKRYVDAPPQNLAGTHYNFNSWSDGGAKTHEIIFPETSQILTANFSPVTSDCTAGLENFAGCYFSDQTLSDLKLARTDQEINFSWGLGNPAAGLPADNFSARWSGDFNFPVGSYTFTSTTDDGVRVFVDGQKIIDFWQDQSSRSHVGSINLSAGIHRVIMEYYENGGEAVAKLTWNKTGEYTPPQVVNCDTPKDNAFNACYYDQMDLSDFKLQRTDSSVDFDWGLGSPDSVVSPDTFSASWIGNFSFDSADYEFSVTADDGVRLYLDSLLLVDRWKDQGPTTYNQTKTLALGNHTVRMEYYENGGGAVARLSWKKLSTPVPPTTVSCGTPGAENFTGCFYNDKNFTNLALTRTDAYPLVFSWGLGSPDPKVNPDNFSAVWQGNFNFDNSSYSFKVTSDDGVKLYIDNELVLDKFFDQGPTSYTIEKALTAGSHLIKMQYYENGGEAVAKLAWTEITTAAPVVNSCDAPATNSFIGCYYSNMNFSGTPIVRTDSAINFSWGLENPIPQIPADKFSAKWLGQFTFTQGSYNFTVTADDGVRLFIDDVLVLDKFFDQPPTSYTFSKALTSGNHSIRMEYYENGGEAVAMLAW